MWCREFVFRMMQPSYIFSYSLSFCFSHQQIQYSKIFIHFNIVSNHFDLGSLKNSSFFLIIFNFHEINIILATTMIRSVLRRIANFSNPNLSSYIWISCKPLLSILKSPYNHHYMKDLKPINTSTMQKSTKKKALCMLMRHHKDRHINPFSSCAPMRHPKFSTLACTSMLVTCHIHIGFQSVMSFVTLSCQVSHSKSLLSALTTLAPICQHVCGFNSLYRTSALLELTHQLPCQQHPFFRANSVMPWPV